MSNLTNNTEELNKILAAVNALPEAGGGITPHIGANGNWFIGDTDTGVKAQGEDGVGIIDIQKRTISGQEMLYIILSDGTEKDIKLPVPENGKDYVLTEADKQEIAEQAAELVEIPEGDTVELDTTLTTSGKAADAKAVGDALNGKQPVGNYLTEIPMATTATLGGVKPVAKTNEMTRPVGVDNNGRLFSLKQASNSIVVAAFDTADSLKSGADYVCTGTNDQIIIQQAIDSLNCGTVTLLGGTYIITSEINPKSNVNIEGDGNPVLQLQDRALSAVATAIASGDNVVYVANPELFLVGQRVGIKEGTVHNWCGRITAIDIGSGAVTVANAAKNDFTMAATMFSDASVISGYNVENVSVANMTIDGNTDSLSGFTSDTNYGANGIQFDGGSNIRVTRNTIKNVYKHGILFTYGPVDSYVTDNIIYRCGTHGIDLYVNAKRCIVSGNNLYKANIQCHNGSHNTVYGNMLHDCMIKTQEGGSNNLIANNTVIITDGGVRDGIQTTGTSADRNVIVGNKIFGNGKLMQGVQLDGASGATFSNNYICGTTGPGIHLYKIDKCHVHDNTVIDCNKSTSCAAIKIENTCTENRINGNYCVGTAGKTTYGVEELSTACSKNYVDNNVFINAGSGAAHLLAESSVDRDNAVL